MSDTKLDGSKLSFSIDRWNRTILAVIFPSLVIQGRARFPSKFTSPRTVGVDLDSTAPSTKS